MRISLLEAKLIAVAIDGSRRQLSCRRFCVFGILVSALFIFANVARSTESDSRVIAESLLTSSGIKSGLCVHIGCDKGILTAELAANGKFVVHGLEIDSASVESARNLIQSKGIYGQVSVDQGIPSELPYEDNLINLVIVDDLPKALIKGLSLKEVIRVLCPNGVAMLGKEAGLLPQELSSKLKAAGLKTFDLVEKHGVWAKFTKPRDPLTDDWPEWRHGADRNSVSYDAVVKPGNQVRWIGGPYWNFGAGLSLNLSNPVIANGRMFYLELNWAPEGKATVWWVVARDANNGCVLWRKPGSPFYRMLAADGDRVYALSGNQMYCYDAESGEVLHTYPEQLQFRHSPMPHISTESLLVQDGVLVVTDHGNEDLLKKQVLYAGDANSTKLLWKHEYGARPVAGDSKLFLQDNRGFVAVDPKTGQELWRLAQTELPNGEDAVIDHFARGQLLLVRAPQKDKPFRLYAISSQNGKLLWSYELGNKTFPFVFSFKDDIWLTRGPGANVLLDPVTGAEKKHWMHKGQASTCGFPCATETYLIFGHGGTYEDRKTFEEVLVEGVRSLCGDCEEEIPANGLQYYMPMACVCAPGLRGVFALSGSGEAPMNTATSARLQRGSAIVNPESTSPEDWPCYRKDSRRSNAATTEVSPRISKLWEAKPGTGLLSPLTVAHGLVFGSDVDGLQVFALDAITGKERWRYVVSGRVDVPPVIEGGYCVFGSKDGWIHCLAAQTGQLVWRYRAAPNETLMAVCGRLESPWPIVGGVLVQNGAVYFCAGRCKTMDGGLTIGALELATGNSLWTSSGKWNKPSGSGRSGAACGDMLIGDGQSVYMSGTKFEPKTGTSGATPVINGILQTKSEGKVGVEQVIWQHEPFEGRRPGLTDGRLEAWSLAFTAESSYGASPIRNINECTFSAKGAANWVIRQPLQGLALIVAGKTVFCAAVPMDRDVTKSSQLLLFSASEGTILKTIELPAKPVADGMAAARGCLYLAMQDGKVICFGNSRGTKEPSK